MKKVQHIAKALALIMTLMLMVQSGQMVFAAESFHAESKSVLNSERTEAADGNASGQATDVSLLDDKDAPADKACMDEEAALVSVSETEEETDSAGQQKADANDQIQNADTNNAACDDGIKVRDDAPKETPDAAAIAEGEQETVSGTDASGQTQYNNTPITGSGNSGGVTVNVNAPAGSFPEGTTLSVVPMDESETGNLISGLSDVAAAAAFNITFTDADGNTVQPAEGKAVDVTFTNEANFDMTGGKEICIYHFGDNGLEKLASQTVSQPGSNSSISVQAASFSPYIEVYTLDSETSTEETANGPSSIQQKPEGYLTLHVEKKWEGDETHPDSISVHLSPALGQSNDIVLNERNNWEGDFADLPLYDASGKKIEYSVSETTVDGYTASYSSATETSRKDYWVMVNAPEELENGRKYVIAAQDWGQSIYYNNPNTYYFLKGSDSGYNGLIGLHRIEHTNTVFTGPKTGNGTPELVLGGKAYDEYLDPDSSTTKELAANEMWLLGKQGSLWMLQNEEISERMTLKGENNWWVYWNPHVYSFVCSNEDGWHADENVNYSQLLDITDANDGMARISSRQEWGNYGTDTRYLYLNLTSYAQTTGAVDNADHAGQFKFFTPITEVKQTITITNTTDDQVSIPVMKKWVGPEKEQVTVMLLADGVKKQSAVLTREDSWKTTFSNLPKYDSLDGHEIVYSISEIPVDGYSSVISGTAWDGYIITNTIAGKISIPVTKVWSGGTGSKAVVHLFADGVEIASQELNAGCQWQHTFENLDKYKDGKEISYTLTEDGIPGYSSAITYSAERGFTVTNTKDPDGHHDGGGHGGDHGNGSGTGAVGLYKVDAQTGAYLAGAQFALYRSDGTCIGTYTTDSNGYLKVQNLAYGSYYFAETKAPENYVLDPNYVRFTLDKAHSTGNAYPWNIKVSNTKSGVKTITVGGTKTWEKNNNGTGGQKTVPSAGTEVSRSVATGDDSHMMLYLLLMIGSLIVLAADLVFLRRHKEAGK